MKKIKLLLVDDHQIILDGISSFLEKENDFEIMGFALDGEGALDFLAHHMVDVVVMDISMPHKDGIETARVVRKEFPNIKIILLTMQGDGQYILNAMKLGVHGYVLKEKSKEILVRAIHCVHTGSTYWSPDLIPRIANAQLIHYEGHNDDIHLTLREKEIICLLVKEPSLTAKQMADRLNIAALTVETHLRNARQKLKISTSRELMQYAQTNNLCSKHV
ncbi:MAG: response regulator transcription factor [Bacteroidetes bacterium]|nr:response regulator transcription factor [Bacteroidota bacterium]